MIKTLEEERRLFFPSLRGPEWKNKDETSLLISNAVTRVGELVIDESFPSPAGVSHILKPCFKMTPEHDGGRHSHWVRPSAAVAFFADDGGAEMLGVG